MKAFKEDRIIKIFNIGLFLLFALLIFKDPFSQRTLIPNFEPSPDTVHYINPALSFAKGTGFNIKREDRLVSTSVPPLYSISLIPAFILKQDPRMAYYSNVVLGFTSLLLFWFILRKLFTNKLIIYLLVILYITNYYIYWVPSIIMAENLTLTLYLAAVFCLLSAPTIINSITIAFLAIAVYATKYAGIPVSITVLLVYFFKLFSLQAGRRKLIFAFLVSLIFAYSFLAMFELTKGKSFLSQLLSFLNIIYNNFPKSNTASVSTTSMLGTWFSIGYMEANLPFYIKAIFGASSRFLWDSTPLVPGFIGVLGSLAIVWNIFNKKFRFICTMFFVFLFSSIMFISTLYTYDARYIYIAIPTLLMGFGIFLAVVDGKVSASKKFIFNVFILVIIAVYLATNFTRIKSQISLNLRYAETPWSYIAVLKMNEYFTSDKVVEGKKPILISALQPFLIDYYTNGNYTLLPLSYEQEFRDRKEIIWGANDYSNLPKLYTKYLNEGYSVYVSRSGLGNEGYTNRDFNTIVAEFDTKLVLPGCFDQCNIYSVKLKEKNVK